MTGRRLLIVEDEALIAMLLEDMLGDLGYQIAGMAPSVEEASKLAQMPDLDAAILDVNVNGQPIFPVAKMLRDRGIPILFASGYGEASLPEDFRGCPVLQKPFQQSALEAKIASLFPAEQSAPKTGAKTGS